MAVDSEKKSEINIVLSQYSKALLEALNETRTRQTEDEGPRISVSSTVSFLAIVYEKIRNAVEFREEHLIRRAAIERILKRRLALNPGGQREAENLVRELLWAKYLKSDTAPETLVSAVQKILNKYLHLKKNAIEGRQIKTQKQISRFIFDLMTCEIEEELNPEESARKTAYLYYFYQVLKNKVEIKGVDRQKTDMYFYVASESAFAKSDKSYLNYHLFKLEYKPLSGMSYAEIDELCPSFEEIVDDCETLISNPFNDKLSRFAKKHVPPFLILFSITDRSKKDLGEFLTNTKKLWLAVDAVCRRRYQETGKKLRRAAVRSIIYIFLTKMFLVLLLEYPLTQYFYGAVHLFPVLLNTLFPPLLMGIIVSFVRVPGSSNTQRIYFRIIDILNRDPSFETKKNIVTSQPKIKRPILLLGFTIFYVFTFGITFSLIYIFLELLRFNFISKFIFVFFLCVVTFFAYRIRQTAKEYVLEDRPGILSPVVDFFFIPILSVGKFLSSEIAKLNIFILIFDFLIEAPFKLLFEIVEEWISFVRQRKEEIT